MSNRHKTTPVESRLQPHLKTVAFYQDENWIPETYREIKDKPPIVGMIVLAGIAFGGFLYTLFELISQFCQ